MIQRIQTVFLLLTTLTGVLFLLGDMISFSNPGGEIISVGIKESLFLAAPGIIIPLVSFITVFLYKNRKLQLRLTAILLVLIIALLASLAYYYYHFTSSSEAVIRLKQGLAYPFLMLLFSYLAYRGIKKDDELVKSYDRLR